MSIRLRLTLLYTAILALALIGFGTALYVTQSQITLDIVKNNLAQQADLMTHGPRRDPRPGAVSPSEYIPGRWTELRNLDGAVIGRTADLSNVTLPLSDAGLSAVQGGANWYEIAALDNAPLLVYSRPFYTQSGTNEIVQVAAPITEREQSLNTLKSILILGSALVIALAFAISWVVAGTVLRPIHRITQTAQAIGAERNLSARVAHSGPNDEVGQLATTFNGMLNELEAAYHKLEQALDTQRRFVADASHELRTPLTTVRGNIELLNHEPPLADAELAEVLADTKDEVDRLIRLVSQLLALARRDAGQPLRREPLALKPLLEDICRQARSLAPQRTVICKPFPEVLVLGNRDALKQVLLILLDNAVVHTPAQAMITLAAAETDHAVEIQVSDTGAGIAPEVLPHIFERFYRGDVARSGRSAGLGLAIARELVHAQEAAIRVESEAGRGTVFTVTCQKAIS